LASLVFPLHIIPASAGVDQWTSIGPEGGVVHALVIAPSNPNVLYAGTSGGGVYRSADGGASWTAANGGLTEIAHILTLVVDPSNENRVYAGSWDGVVYKSTDGGAHWSDASIG
jgi:photosystem II stability/assembly factor-like uncharacterized protein